MVVLLIGFYFSNNSSCFLASSTTKAGNNCYIKNALENNDEKYCAKLEGSYEAWTSDNLMGSCYTELAVLNKDSSYCVNITGKYLDIVKRDCYTASAFAQNYPTV